MTDEQETAIRKYIESLKRLGFARETALECALLVASVLRPSDTAGVRKVFDSIFSK